LSCADAREASKAGAESPAAMKRRRDNSIFCIEASVYVQFMQ
jgi:hypothetical protein